MARFGGFIQGANQQNATTLLFTTHEKEFGMTLAKQLAHADPLDIFLKFFITQSTQGMSQLTLAECRPRPLPMVARFTQMERTHLFL
jgi:hypothetical protein